MSDMKENEVIKLKKKMHLTSHLKSRRHLTRLINEFNRDPEANVSRYRCIVFMFKTLLDYFSFEKDAEIEKKMEEMQEQLNRIQGEDIEEA